MSPELETLRRKPHVHSMSLDIYDGDNMNDIALFVPHRLKQVADQHGLGDDWPDQQTTAVFQAKAEGLFLWVATTCDYLQTCYFPKKELEKLISTSYVPGSSAESKMDRLYATILHACNWSDNEFAESCHRLLGAAVATKTPLTMRALNALHQCTLMESVLALRQLSPLLTGLSNEQHTTQPVRLLHQSLRDFLTLRAGNPSAPADSHKFAIDEQMHSQALGLLCLCLLNRELNGGTPGVGYLVKDEEEFPGIALIGEDDLSEELWYACLFWLDHLLDAKSLTTDALEQLQLFMSTKITLWMELMAARGRYEGLSRLREWAKGHDDHYPSLTPLIYNTAEASALHKLAKCLNYMGRREEALTAAQDEVAAYRRLLELEGNRDDSQASLARSLCSLSAYLTGLGYLEDSFGAAHEAVTLQRQLKAMGLDVADADLAKSLQRLSVGHTDLGQYEDGLAAIQEAVKLQRQLTSEQNAPIMLTSDLAKSLRTLSIDLHYIGRYEDALAVTQEEVDIYRRLSAQRPAAFTPDLAGSLQSLSCDLSNLGRYEEALTMSREAVALRRQLATERPAVFTPSLADSLHALSCDLAYVGSREETLPPLTEAIELWRQLAKERPAVFTAGLADSLHNLSCELSTLDRHEEALKSSLEAVELRRQLAAERPAVYTPRLADSLHNYSCSLSGLGRNEEALATIREAVSLFRQAAVIHPTVIPDLALSLDQLSYCEFKLGKGQEAVVSMKECVELYRPLVQQYPAVYAAKLSKALHWLARYLDNTGAREEAQEVWREAGLISSTERLP